VWFKESLKTILHHKTYLFIFLDIDNLTSKGIKMIFNSNKCKPLTFEATDRIIDKKELSKLIPYSEVQIQRLEKKGLFPKRIKIGANRVGWSLNEINDWIETRKNDRDEKISLTNKEGS